MCLASVYSSAKQTQVILTKKSVNNNLIADLHTTAGHSEVCYLAEVFEGLIWFHYSHNTVLYSHLNEQLVSELTMVTASKHFL